METRKIAICGIIASLVSFAGCAVSPEKELKRQEMEADVDEILSYELDPAEYGEPRDCLPDNNYRSYRALGDRHLLFEGRKDKLWVNVLRGRCAGLDDDSIFIMMPRLAGNLCDMDRFNVVDRSDSLSRMTTAPACVLGQFKPVTEAQVTEIEERLEMR